MAGKQKSAERAQRLKYVDSKMLVGYISGLFVGAGLVMIFASVSDWRVGLAFELIGVALALHPPKRRLDKGDG